MSRTALLALAAACALAQSKKPVTLADAAAASPAPSAPGAVWSPDGTRFVWTERGALKLYSEGRVRDLLKLAELEKQATPAPPPDAFDWQNRRVTERTAQWFPDGKRLLVRAGGDLFAVDAASGAAAALTRTAEAERDPKLSPDGARVSFRRGHNLFVLTLASRREKRLTHDGSWTRRNAQVDWVYPEELNLGTAHWWSPDSRRIAYLQFEISSEPEFPHAGLLGVRGRYEPQRYPKAGDPNATVRVGVIGADGGGTKWMDLGPSAGMLIARVDWLPDSSALAVRKMPRIQTWIELIAADARTGRSRVLLREEGKPWVNLNDLFRFVEGGKRFLWGSERDGFRHLYLYAADGKLERQLTIGAFEIASVPTVTEDGVVYFVSSEASPLERRLYSMRLDGTAKRLLTPEPGTHAVSVAPGGKLIIDTHSSLQSPPRRVVRSADGSTVAALDAKPASFDQYDLRPVEIVPFTGADGAKFYAKLIKPAAFDPARKYPAVVFVYGGPHAQNVTNQWGGLSWEQALAHRGFVVWQMDNRGTAGRGYEWERAVARNLGAQELKDQQEGVKHLLSLGFVDPARLGLYGWSYGGFMTLYTMTHAPGLFRAGVSGAPVVDWRLYDSIYTERYMDVPSTNPEGYRKASPLHKAADLQGHLMLVHNFGDDNVHFQQSLQMADALQRAGKPFRMMVYPQRTHGVTGAARKHMLEAMTAFFEETLRDQ